MEQRNKKDTISSTAVFLSLNLPAAEQEDRRLGEWQKDSVFSIYLVATYINSKYKVVQI